MAEVILARFATNCKDCGKLRNLPNKPISDRCRSCAAAIRGATHGMSKSRLYHIWSGVLSRAAGHVARKHYADKGVTVSGEWVKFEGFRDWALSSGYADDLEIDRVDNDGNYEPANCRWVTRMANVQNSTRSRNIAAFGKTQCVSAWAREMGIKGSTLDNRLNRLGMSPEQALTYTRWAAKEVTK
jgi:hypothetical protein